MLFSRFFSFFFLSSFLSISQPTVSSFTMDANTFVCVTHSPTHPLLSHSLTHSHPPCRAVLLACVGGSCLHGLVVPQALDAERAALYAQVEREHADMQFLLTSLQDRDEQVTALHAQLQNERELVGQREAVLAARETEVVKLELEGMTQRHAWEEEKAEHCAVLVAMQVLHNHHLTHTHPHISTPHPHSHFHTHFHKRFFLLLSFRCVDGDILCGKLSFLDQCNSVTFTIFDVFVLLLPDCV
jgi:hypothetical protein